MKIDYNKIGNQVKKYRNMRGMSQEQLAEEAEITSKHVSSIEHGRTKLSVECLISVANALKVTPNHLVSDFVVQKQGVLDDEWARLLHGYTMKEQKKFLKFFHAFLDIEKG